MKSFSAKIKIIGINPYVLVPPAALKALFKQAGKDKGAIPVKGTLNGHKYIQTLVKFRGKWRLYLNGPMRAAAGIDVGETAHLTITFDPKTRKIPMQHQLEKAFAINKKAKETFDALTPSRQKEILRYISFLRSEQAIDKNIKRILAYLNQKEGSVKKK